MKTQRLNYESPEVELIRFSPERNFCESTTDVSMSDNIFDDIDVISLPDIW